MRELSILIPTFNDVCFELVSQLQRQAEALDISYEIIVADDGSTDSSCIATNRQINQLPHCRLTERKENTGRAVIRNFLANEAQYELLLFIDSDMTVCRTDYLSQYMVCGEHPIVDGGVVINKTREDNLRSLYEKAAEQQHTADKRRESPYRDFHTANFMIRRTLMLAHPFDNRFRHYGYEDVLFGKEMEQQGIAIHHIDNPLSFEIFESNADFLSKSEEGLRTLYLFREELRGYNRLLKLADRLPHAPFRLWHRLFASFERRQLTGKRPSLTVFQLYRLGYFFSLYS